MTVAELVYMCCFRCPKKKFIEDIIKLEKTMNMPQLAKSIFDHKNKNGINCLIVSFNMMRLYENETGNKPDSSVPMFNEIESTVLYLIKLAEDNKLNMDKILNWMAENGMNLFYGAALYSESLALELLRRNVDVKTVDNLFRTPPFRVSFIFFGF